MSKSGEIEIEEFSKVDLRVGVVKKAERVPGSKKLMKLVVDLGIEERQLVAGIAEWYNPEELVGKHVVVVANLKPKRIMGHLSQGMVLATCDEHSKPVLVTVSEPVNPGAKIC
ncbi:MAG: methionine--tRNA ligase subunit beta [Sulfolobales archaeon]|nr:methionine--tRNA ligase subunit beta [Sulfolobales archaeon]MDW8082620.1 methionine--tRNA ligase subunit beta [Sulfolobales archaeon]